MTEEEAWPETHSLLLEQGGTSPVRDTGEELFEEPVTAELQLAFISAVQ